MSAQMRTTFEVLFLMTLKYFTIDESIVELFWKLVIRLTFAEHYRFWELRSCIIVHSPITTLSTVTMMYIIRRRRTISKNDFLCSILHDDFINDLIATTNTIILSMLLFDNVNRDINVNDIFILEDEIYLYSR